MRITIKAARINKGLKQSDVAKALNVTQKTVGSWEQYRTKPSIDKVEQLCELFGTDYDHIVWNGQ